MGELCAEKKTVRPTCRQKDDIKTGAKQIGSQYVEWINMDQIRLFRSGQ